MKFTPIKDSYKYDNTAMKIGKSSNCSNVIGVVLILVLAQTSLETSARGQDVMKSAPESSKVERTDSTTNVDKEIIRVYSDLISLPATVTDREGRYVTNLTKEDFQIFENGIEQEISDFEPINTPFTIFFLLDTSSSMTSLFPELGRAADAFLSQLHPSDQIIVASFDQFVEILQKQTRVDAVRGRKKLRLRTRSMAYSNVYTAVDFALNKLSKVAGRKAVVLFSDGEASEKLSHQKKQLRRAAEGGTSIYTIRLTGPPIVASHRPEYIKQSFAVRETAKKYMEDLAQVTGGRYYNAEEISDLQKTFKMVADELGRQYSLGYYPKTKPKPGERREIKVRVKQPGMVVRARDSYIAGKPKSK